MWDDHSFSAASFEVRSWLFSVTDEVIASAARFLAFVVSAAGWAEVRVRGTSRLSVETTSTTVAAFIDTKLPTRFGKK